MFKLRLHLEITFEFPLAMEQRCFLTLTEFGNFGFYCVLLKNLCSVEMMMVNTCGNNTSTVLHNNARRASLHNNMESQLWWVHPTQQNVPLSDCMNKSWGKTTY